MEGWRVKGEIRVVDGWMEDWWAGWWWEVKQKEVRQDSE